jgi:hypothetical protein
MCRDLIGCGDPHIAVAGDVGERIGKVFVPERLPGDEGVDTLSLGSSLANIELFLSCATQALA